MQVTTRFYFLYTSFTIKNHILSYNILAILKIKKYGKDATKRGNIYFAY